MRPQELTTEQVAELFALFRSAFQADRHGFEQDLLEKDRVLVVKEGTKLRAFSTLRLYRPRAGVRVFFSGDTFACPEARLGHRLPALWAEYVFGRMAAEPGVQDYWLLLCSGYRTYRILPTFFREYAPGVGDRHLLSLRDSFAEGIFGERYRKGVVTPRFATPLLDPEPPERLRDNPHVRLFLQANPGYREGRELACLVPLTDGNLTPAGRRLALKR